MVEVQWRELQFFTGNDEEQYLLVDETENGVSVMPLHSDHGELWEQVAKWSLDLDLKA